MQTPFEGTVGSRQETPTPRFSARTEGEDQESRRMETFTLHLSVVYAEAARLDACLQSVDQETHMDGAEHNVVPGANF